MYLLFNNGLHFAQGKMIKASKIVFLFKEIFCNFNIMQGILVFLIILFQRWPFLIILPLSNLLRHFESSFSEKKKSRNHYQQIIKTFYLAFEI